MVIKITIKPDKNHKCSRLPRYKKEMICNQIDNVIRDILRRHKVTATRKILCR